MSDFVINDKKFSKPLKVLVVPLDWGLGHATRCVPIIKKLLACNYEVMVASEGAQLELLKLEFPDLSFLTLRGYRMHYGKTAISTVLRILLQIPKILTRIRDENRWLQHMIDQEQIDMVISDNRYGLYSSKIFTVFLTHQLHIRTAFGKMADRLLQLIQYRFINRFNTCWVADNESGNIMAGILSHPARKPQIPVQYIGLLSRFEKLSVSRRCKLLVLLSGPEPQRTLFEKKIRADLTAFREKAILVRGLPDKEDTPRVTGNLTVYNHLPAVALNEIICSADLVICRSGYSTMMDLIRLGIKSIVIPTPGQTEQQYIADYLSEKKIVLKKDQKNFSLAAAIRDAEGFPFVQHQAAEPDLLGLAIERLPAADNGFLRDPRPVWDN